MTVKVAIRSFANDEPVIVMVPNGAYIETVGDEIGSQVLRVSSAGDIPVALFRDWSWALLLEDPDEEAEDEESAVTEVIAVERADGTKEFYAVPVAA